MLGRNVERFRGGLVVEALELLHRSTLGSRVIKKKKKKIVFGVCHTVSTHNILALSLTYHTLSYHTVLIYTVSTLSLTPTGFRLGEERV